MATKKATPAKKTKPAGKGVDGAPLGHRPSLYKPEYDDQAYKLCLLGATDKRIADFFCVTEQTLNNWKLAHATFFESLKRGKEIADAEIAHSLFHRAKGYSHPEVHVSNYQGVVTLTDLTKHYPPDTPAAALWLKNRDPERWREKVDLEHTGKNGGPIESNVTLTPADAYKAMLGR